jgi:hypothetical protein
MGFQFGIVKQTSSVPSSGKMRLVLRFSAVIGSWSSFAAIGRFNVGKEGIVICIAAEPV